MNLEEIKKVVNDNENSDDIKIEKIIKILSKDKKVIHIVLAILNSERETTNELISEMNNELSRADAFIESWIPPNPILKKGEKENGINKTWILEQINKFYDKYKEFVKHNYKKQEINDKDN